MSQYFEAFLQPDAQAEKAFLRLGASKVDIADRELVFQNGVKSMASKLRDLTSESEATRTRFKTVSEHTISLLHKSGRPSARGGLSLHELPSAETVFKDLLESNTTAAGNHPSGLSSLTYALSCLLSLSIRQPNDALSSCFDLYPLYGHLPSDANEVRMKDGSGMLSPDCYFDDRLVFLPKASAVLLILFNRNHNYIARRLLLHKADSKPPHGTSNGEPISQALISQDDEIFETARRINCGHFRNIMLEDVLKPLMGLPIVGPNHNLDLLMETKGSPSLGIKLDGFIESALLYDWSSLMGAGDIQHLHETLSEALSDDPERISSTLFSEKMKDITARFAMDTNKRNRDCPGLERDKDGLFPDSELARILYDSTESPAGGTGRTLPSCQRGIQIETIQWARASKACTLNEYRSYLGLKPLQSFAEWTSDSRAAAIAERMYKSIDNLELYVGLQAENTTNDQGFQFGFTKTYGLLVDIVSRIRSDPSLTTKLTADNLTAWGFQDCQLKDYQLPRPDNGSFGAFFPKILQRTLPRNYSYNNIYGLFPFSVPQNTIVLLPRSASLADYEQTRPQTRTIHSLTTNIAIRNVLNDPDTFPTAYGDSLTALTSGYGYFLGFDDEARHDQDQLMSLHALIPDGGALKKYAQSFSRMTQECILEAHNTKPGEIDVARDVINAVCTRWVCQTLLDYQIKIDEKTGGSPKTDEEGFLIRLVTRLFFWFWYQIAKIAVKFLSKDSKLIKWVPSLAIILGPSKSMPVDSIKLNQKDLHDKFAELYAFVFHNVDTENEWILRKRALATSDILSKHIHSKLPPPRKLEFHGYSSFTLESLKSIGRFVTRLAKEYRGTEIPGQSAQTFLDRIMNANQSIPAIGTDPEDEAERNRRVVANVLGLAVVAAVKFAKVSTQVVDFYMQDEHTDERNKIIEIATRKENEPGANSKALKGYIKEAYRLNHPLGVWRTVIKSSTIPQGYGLPDIIVNAGDSVYADFSTALKNPFDPDFGVDPLIIDPKREIRGIQGLGLHKCPGIGFVDYTMPEILKAIFQLKGIHRAPGRKGKLVQFTAHGRPRNTDPKLFIDSKNQLVAYPDSLVIRYDTAADIGGWERFDARKKKDAWEIKPGKTTERQRKIMDRSMTFVGLSVIVWMIYSVFVFVTSLFTARLPLAGPTTNSSLAASPTPEPESAPYPPVCKEPITSMDPWTLATMKARDDGKLAPFEYTLNRPTAHLLNFVDVDAKDMTMSIWLDNVLLGNTYDVVLDKSDNCGDDYNTCLQRRFSGGQILIPKGNHTVRVQWAGVELPGPDGRIDWGDEGGRRIAWSRDSCSA